MVVERPDNGADLALFEQPKEVSVAGDGLLRIAEEALAEPKIKGHAHL